MLRDINPSVAFFIETKLNVTRMATVRRKCGFREGIDVDSDGRSGGLSMGWIDSYKISLRSYSRSHIDVIVEDDGMGRSWRCIGFYRAPEERFRTESWDLLRQLNDLPNVP